MKNLNVIAPLLASLLLGGMALAQEPVKVIPEAPQPQNIPATQEPIAAYGEDSAGNAIIGQFRRYPQLHRGPIRSSRGQAYPSAYASAPRPPFSVLGALIGFGVGAAIGASGSDHSGTTLGGRVLIGGTIFAVIGGAIGGALPHVRRRYPQQDPDDDEESNVRPHAKGVQEKNLTSAAGQPREAPTAQTVAPPSPTYATSGQTIE
jgi:hypothetical protein